MGKWIQETELKNYLPVTSGEAETALKKAVEQVISNLKLFTDSFPGPASFNNFYRPGPNRGWTTGFWTGEIWLAYEYVKRMQGDESDLRNLLRAGNAQVDSFLSRIEQEIDVDHHDMGFLYSPSCMAGYMLTGNENAKKAAVLAAERLLKRYQPVGEFIQAWGEMGAKDNYRFIIDCLLNLPLLYRVSDMTGEDRFRETAEHHIRTAMRYVIREDDSTWHTVFMNPETGGFDNGATCQGFKDGSAWARGQAWGIYGTAIAYRYTERDEYIGYFKRVTSYFLNHLPGDLIPYWDLTFGGGDEGEPRDSSSSVIAACGMLEMSKYLQGADRDYYIDIARKLLKAVVEKMAVVDCQNSNGQILHGTYSKKSPFNTCTPEGVDECVIWGDYFYMEALTRITVPEWEVYW